MIGDQDEETIMEISNALTSSLPSSPESSENDDNNNKESVSNNVPYGLGAAATNTKMDGVASLQILVLN